MKIGMNIKIDVTKLDKDRLYQGKKGKYADLKAFIDTEQVGEYGDNGTVSQSTSKEERDNGVKMPVCGNVRVFYKQESESKETPQPDHPQEFDITGEQIPF